MLVYHAELEVLLCLNHPADIIQRSLSNYLQVLTTAASSGMISQERHVDHFNLTTILVHVILQSVLSPLA